ncbi:hypothetical protein BaRGS_00001879, partial [Batillaria attramentaria]
MCTGRPIKTQRKQTENGGRGSWLIQTATDSVTLAGESHVPLTSIAITRKFTRRLLGRGSACRQTISARNGGKTGPAISQSAVDGGRRFGVCIITAVNDITIFQPASPTATVIWAVAANLDEWLEVRQSFANSKSPHVEIRERTEKLRTHAMPKCNGQLSPSLPTEGFHSKGTSGLSSVLTA